MSVTDAMYHEPPEDSPTDPKVIKLSRRDVDDARRLLSLLCDNETSVLVEAAAEGPSEHSPQLLLQRARKTLLNRQRRYRAFSRAMFGEPAWDMLLLLYVLQSGARQTIARLADLAGASKSTALRWVDYLEKQRLITREPHPTDRRSAFVTLTDKGKQALELYLSETIGAGD